MKNFDLKLNWKNLLALVFIVVVAFSFYGLTLRGVYGNPTEADFKNNLDQATKPFELSPERGRYVHLIAMAQTGQYNLSETLRDAAAPDVGYSQDGRYYSYFAPGIPYLALPFYLIGQKYNLAQVFTFGFVSLVSTLTMLFLFRIAKDILKLPNWAAIFSTLVFAFGTTAWSYAITLYQHHLTTFFIISSFYAVWKYKQGTKLGWLWAAFVWLNYGLAIFIDYPNAILMLPIMVYLLLVSVKFNFSLEKTKISIKVGFILTAVVFVAITGLHFWHNSYYLGSWKQLSGTLPGYHPVTEVIGLVDTIDEAEEVVIVEEPKKEKSAVGFFAEQKVFRGFNTLTISLDRGFILYEPILLLALLGIFIAIKKKINLETGVLLACVVVNLFLYSSWGDPWGGWAYGPRYLIPSMALLSLFVSLGISQIKYKLIAKIVAYVLFIYSSAVALLGALTTNAVPPQWEAIGLERKYNFILNLDFFNRNQGGSFLYNNYFSQFLDLQQYFFIIYFSLLFIIFIVLFTIPEEKYDS